MKKKNLALMSAFVLAVLMLSACGSSTPAAATLEGTHWKLVSYGSPSSPTPAVADTEATLLFDQQQGQVSGKAGCNGFSGDYKQADGQLMLGQLTSTLMACSDPLMQQESAVLAALNGTVKYELEKDTLNIYSADGQSLLTFARQ